MICTLKIIPQFSGAEIVLSCDGNQLASKLGNSQIEDVLEEISRQFSAPETVGRRLYNALGGEWSLVWKEFNRYRPQIEYLNIRFEGSGQNDPRLVGTPFELCYDGKYFLQKVPLCRTTSGWDDSSSDAVSNERPLIIYNTENPRILNIDNLLNKFPSLKGENAKQLTAFDLTLLPEYNIVYFACHGKLSKSGWDCYLCNSADEEINYNADISIRGLINYLSTVEKKPRFIFFNICGHPYMLHLLHELVNIGVESCIGTLWEINANEVNQMTHAFFTQFYTNGQCIVKALHEARHQLLDGGVNTNNELAGYVLVGNPNLRIFSPHIGDQKKPEERSEPYIEKFEEGDNQKGTVNEVLPIPLTVKVDDGSGKGLSSKVVVFEVDSGGGKLKSDGKEQKEISIPTNEKGEASVEWVLGKSTADEHKVSVYLKDKPQQKVVFNATPKPPPLP